jgi:hypothetical protein
MKDSKWTFPEKLYTTDNIDEFVCKEKRTIQEAEEIIILTGTNHINRGEEPQQILKKIATTLNSLPRNTQKVIMELPPLQDKP